MQEILKIVNFVAASLLHIWPYLLITIPLSVVINISGASKYIAKAFGKHPIAAIFLATAVGAFSPFCSCGVIPVITTLLIGGVPLAPVMSFWIASPSMDPEIFFLSVSVLGWNLAVWRLAATFALSLLAGLTTYFLIRKGLVGANALRSDLSTRSTSSQTATPCCDESNPNKPQPSANSLRYNPTTSCCSKNASVDSNCECGTSQPPKSFYHRLLVEITKSTLMVVKFMALAFAINALITLYVPSDFVKSLLGGNGIGSIITAAAVGIPAYTSNLMALPLVGGLIAVGMNKGAALAFLIAGPTTTLPAMMAVWGIAKRKVFMLYLAFSFLGAIIFGLLYSLFS